VCVLYTHVYSYDAFAPAVLVLGKAVEGWDTVQTEIVIELHVHSYKFQALVLFLCLCWGYVHKYLSSQILKFTNT